MMFVYRTFCICAALLFCACCCSGAAAAAQQNERHTHTKERVKDGAFGSRGTEDKQDDSGRHVSEFDHEAILGSKETAEEFHHLTPEEAKWRLKVLAIKMDINKDGQIDKEELAQWILNSYKKLDKEDSDERHEESDSNSNGYVTWDEYSKENYDLNPFDNPMMTRDDLAQDRKMMMEDKLLFAACDVDGDQRLSLDEYLPFTHPEAFEHTRDILLKRTMEEKDHDKDGYLSLDEYMGDDGKGKDKSWHNAEKDKFDNDYDLDQDGKLSANEVRLWLLPEDRESADMEAEHLIDVTDSNADGLLSIKEVLDHHETFVGSEVTDYGELLQDPHIFKDEL